MALRFGSSGIESRVEAFVEALAASLGHADRAAPFRSYCAGLILPGDRKSVEPMAARLEPGRVQAAHQSLHHFVAKAEWSDQAVPPTSLWSPGEGPLPIKPPGGRGRPSTRLRRTAMHKPVSAKALAHALPEDAWNKVTWREGTNAPLSGRFAAVRVRPAIATSTAARRGRRSG